MPYIPPSVYNKDITFHPQFITKHWREVGQKKLVEQIGSNYSNVISGIGGVQKQMENNIIE